jgi:hypothetical protein
LASRSRFIVIVSSFFDKNSWFCVNRCSHFGSVSGSTTSTAAAANATLKEVDRLLHDRPKVDFKSNTKIES